MLKLPVLLVVGLVRSLQEEVIKAKFEILVDDEAPFTVECEEWTDTVAGGKEPGLGAHNDPFFAGLRGNTGSGGAGARCGEKFALFTKTDIPEETVATIYVKIAAYDGVDSTDFEIGDSACQVDDCTFPFGQAVKLPTLSILPPAVSRSDVMCDGFVQTEGGDGTLDDPIYVYVDDTSLFNNGDCGRVYGFGAIKFVVVAGTTTAGVTGDGLELGITTEDCNSACNGSCDLSICGLYGYAIWTGSTFVPVTTTTPEPTTTISEEITTTTAPPVNTQSSTSSTSTTETTTEETTTEDSTVFAAVGFTLVALLA